MNYFDLYEIKIAYDIDLAALKNKFYDLSKKYHPDLYVNTSLEKQEEILHLCTLINKAYQVLSNPSKRIEYILTLFNLVGEDGKYHLPETFLIEMMEINERLIELHAEPDSSALERLRGKIQEIDHKLFMELEKCALAFDHGTLEDREKTLLKMKDVWYRQKYLLRIRDSLNNFAHQ